MALCEQLHYGALVHAGALGSDTRYIVPVEAQPLQINEQLLCKMSTRPVAIDIIDAKHNVTILAASMPPRDKQAEGMTQMELPCGAGSQSSGHVVRLGGALQFALS